MEPNDEKVFDHNSDKPISKDERLKNLLRECVREWSEHTTAHGFANISRANSVVVKLIWAALLILSVSYCIYSLVGYFNSYLNFDVNVNYVSIIESPAEFPAVTICNMNPFDVTSESSSGDYVNNLLVKNGIKPNIDVGVNDTGVSLVQNAANLLKAGVTSDKNLTDENLAKLGFSMETMLVSCFFNGAQCYASNFTWSRSFEYGNCYTFNAALNSNGSKQDSLKTSKAGPGNGFVLELFIGVPGQQDYYTINKGVFVAVHNRTKTPQLKYEGFTCQTGSYTNIGITRTFYSKLEYPYSNCRKDTQTILSSDSDIYKNTLKITKYSQNLCYEVCLQTLYIIPNCGCADPSIPAWDKSQLICSNGSSLDCVSTQRDEFDKMPIGDICDTYCPMECDNIAYSYSISSSNYPSKYYLSIIKQQSGLLSKFTTKHTFSPSTSLNSNIKGPKSNQINPATTTASSSTSSTVTDDTIQSSFLMINVFYNDLRYTLIEETQAVTLETLIGIIGGQFGLFIGASFLTFIEMIETLIDLVVISIKYYKERNKIINEKTN